MSWRDSRELRAGLASLATLLCLALVPAASGAAASSRPLELVSQTSTVLASSSGQTSFSMTLATAGTGLHVATKLYAPITTRSGFVSALTSGPTQLVDQTDPLAVSCLPRAAGGAVLSIDVVTSSSTTPTVPGGCRGQSPPPTYDLHCTPGSGDCNGVYPVVVSVEQQGGSTVASFTTFMTFVEHVAPTPLRAAVVLRIGPGPSASASSVRMIARSLLAHPTVAVDLAVVPRSLQFLGRSAEGRSAMATLRRAIAADPSAHEVLQAPYVPVDPGALSASGLAGNVTRQLNRGRRQLRTDGLAMPGADAPWLATAPVTSSTTAALEALGLHRLLVPDSSLAIPTSTSLDWGQPFTATPGSTSVSSLAIDQTLSSEMRSGNDPVLNAEQLLADLAFLHFERPSLSQPQGVVAATPEGWIPSRAFLTTLLGGLAGDPVAAASTTSSLFATLSTGANGSPTTRKLATAGPSAPWPTSQIDRFTTERHRQLAFASAARGGATVEATLRDSLLASCTDVVGTRGRAVAQARAARLLDAQLATVEIGGGDITLTALKGSIPITLTKTAPYDVVGILHLNGGSHLSFPSGSSFPVTINSTTKSIRVQAIAHTTGDLPLEATLVTPTGGLVIAHQRVVVRATQTSIVGIILTIGAALVLGFWWVRTWWRKPRKRRSST